MSRLLGLLVIVVAVVNVGCVTPEPVIRMTPMSENLLWVSGVPALVKDGKSARVGAAFGRQQGELLSFHIEIENLAMTPILVGPGNFYYAACNLPDDGKTRQCRPARWVVNPEKVLLDLDIAHARQVADHANQQGLAGAFLLLDMAAIVASTASRNPHTTGMTLAHTASTAGAIVDLEAAGQRESAVYQNQRAQWANVALRKTTLMPGNRMAGMVYLARDMTANQVYLQIRIGDEVMVFPFRQDLIDTRRHRTAQERFPNRGWRGM